MRRWRDGGDVLRMPSSAVTSILRGRPLGPPSFVCHSGDPLTPLPLIFFPLSCHKARECLRPLPARSAAAPRKRNRRELRKWPTLRLLAGTSTRLWLEPLLACLLHLGQLHALFWGPMTGLVLARPAPAEWVNST